jgi:hypothetical protein
MGTKCQNRHLLNQFLTQTHPCTHRMCNLFADLPWAEDQQERDDFRFLLIQGCIRAPSIYQPKPDSS